VDAQTTIARKKQRQTRLMAMMALSAVRIGGRFFMRYVILKYIFDCKTLRMSRWGLGRQ